MENDYKLLQMAEQLYEHGKMIRSLQKDMLQKRRSGMASSASEMQAAYQHLKRETTRWNQLEAEYIRIQRRLQKKVSRRLSDRGKCSYKNAGRSQTW